MPSFGIPDLSPALEADLVSRMAQVEVLLRKQIDGKYPLVVETSRHLVEAGGKRLRPLLTLITSHYGNPSAPGIIEAAVVGVVVVVTREGNVIETRFKLEVSGGRAEERNAHAFSFMPGEAGFQTTQ